MSRSFPPLACLALGSLALFARPARGAEPTCQRWDVDVTCETTPSRVIVNDPFTTTVTVKNSGDVALANVKLELRPDLGSRRQDGQKEPVTSMIEKLEPGATQSLSAVFVCDTVGITRVLGGGRDSMGWAAANCACTVDVIGLPAVQSEMSDKDLKGNESGVFRKGESFQYVLEVQNDGGSTVTPDLKIVYALPKELEFVSGTADRSVTVTGQGSAAESSVFVLAPNEKLKVTIVVKVLDVPPSHWVQTKASIQTTGGIAVAEESESTTLR